MIFLSFDSVLSAESEVAGNWAQVIMGVKVNDRLPRSLKTENNFHGLREVCLDKGSEGGVGAGGRSVQRAQARLKERRKTRAL